MSRADPRVFTNAELRDEYDTTAALRSADRLREYVDWIRKTNKLDITLTTSDHVRERS